MPKCYLAHARHDENGNTRNGQNGDQNQDVKMNTNDSKGEVSITPFFVHKKGWFVLRPKSILHANKIAKLAKVAANNINIGYNQNKHSNGLMKHGGVYTKEKTATDCSGLVRQCIYEATGKDLGNFRTREQVEVFNKSKLFFKEVPYEKGMELYDGDIVVTQVSGHTAVIVDSIYKRV